MTANNTLRISIALKQVENAIDTLVIDECLVVQDATVLFEMLSMFRDEFQSRYQ